MAAHPYAELLKDRTLRAFWAGITLSAVGSELYRVGAIWIAATLAGPNAALLVTAQSAAIVAVSLLAGPAVEAWPRRTFLVATEVACALIAAAVVVAGLGEGLTFPLLVAAGVALAAIQAMARPVFLSGLPTLAPGKVREVNGLFDSSVRIAQAAGPFLAAGLLKAMPAIHLLTANTLTFLASAAACFAVGDRLDGGRVPPAREPILRRLGRGVRAANGCPGVWSVLIATGVRGGAYALGYTVAVPLLFVEGAKAGGGGLSDLAIVVGVGATAEIVSTPLLVLTSPRRPLRRLFAGYVMIGTSLALMGAAAVLAPAGWRVPALAAAALLVGVGNSVATLQITTFFATCLAGDDYAALLRLRLVTIIGSIMLATALGPPILSALGPAATILACGVVATASALAGLAIAPTRRYGPGFESAQSPRRFA
ncbi:MFS transporter [Phenylobacterium sp.]|uniref:MFS transporter n=1 Tax=Phenylobacterium sp. TaxID=1871053 RepID=UPI0026009CAA|nr:MFS transporter [Phenylobacterium sp.]MBX3485636.1 hypothetical protein [Phenylobacterium sp.]MCW5759794.1 hypothetical protein [Phenylobacterium sp.]